MSLLPPEDSSSELTPVVPTGLTWRHSTPAPVSAQMAFVDAARAAMDQPSLEDCEEHLGEEVTIKLSDGEIVTGILTAVERDEPGKPTASVTVDGRVLPLRSIESLS